MEGRVGRKIIGGSLVQMYIHGGMKRRSKFKVTYIYMYKRITGIGLKREETGDARCAREEFS